MKNPFSYVTKERFWLVVATAAATAAIGFTWGGWVTGATARTNAAAAASAAKVAALAPICAAQFQAQQDAPTKLAALLKESTWSRGNVVEKSGFASMPDASGKKQPDSDVAKACAEMLSALPPAKS